MTAFVKIGYNQIARMASSVSVSVFDGAFAPVDIGPNELPIQNLFYGGSTVFWRNSTTEAIGATLVTLTIPAELPAQTIDYLAIRGLNLMFAAGSGDISFDIIGDGNTIYDGSLNPAITEADLVGSFGEDFILTFDESAAYRVFEIYIYTTNEIPHRLRKIYLGKLFDFDNRSPSYPYKPGYGENGTPFTSDAGSVFKTSMGRRARELEFAWKHISDASRIFLDKEIHYYASDYPIFLYEPPESDHSPLNGDTLLFGWVEFDIQTKDWKNNNPIALMFREDIVG